jgi:hypothetical protein
MAYILRDVVNEIKYYGVQWGAVKIQDILILVQIIHKD